MQSRMTKDRTYKSFSISRVAELYSFGPLLTSKVESECIRVLLKALLLFNIGTLLIHDVCN